MKIVCCINKDLESNITLNFLKEIFANHDIWIIFSNGVGKESNSLQELSFYEQHFVNQCLFPTIEEYCSPKKIEQKVFDDKFLTLNQISIHYNSPLNYFDNINSQEAKDFLLRIEPDLIISIRYGKIFGQDIISIPKHGVINLHSGILPDYRGVLATFRAMLNDEKKIGATLHYIDNAKIDSGPIINISYLDINKEKSLLWHIANLYNGGSLMIKDVISKINSGSEINVISQDVSAGNYYSYPTEKDVKLFLQKGYKIFDYNDYMELLSKYI